MPTLRQRHSCISHGSNVDHNTLRSWHATMYKFVTSMVRCGLGMQQCAMHSATIRKTTFFKFGVYSICYPWDTSTDSNQSLLSATSHRNINFCLIRSLQLLNRQEWYFLWVSVIIIINRLYLEASSILAITQYGSNDPRGIHECQHCNWVTRV